ncbi:WD40/YVTN repeat-like-containing protein [Cryptosporidium meleagridis]
MSLGNNGSGGINNGGYEDLRFGNKSGTHNMAFQDLSGKHTGYLEIQQNNNNSAQIIMDDHEIGGGSSQRMDQLGGLTQSNSNTGSLAGSQSSIGSQSYQSQSLNSSSASLPNSNSNLNSNLNMMMMSSNSVQGHNSVQNRNSSCQILRNSIHPSNSHYYSNQNLNSSVSQPGQSQFQHQNNHMQQLPQNVYHLQMQNSAKSQQSSRSHSVPPSSSPSPSSSPTLQASQLNDYPLKGSCSQSSQVQHSPSPSLQYSQSSQFSQPSRNSNLYQPTQPSHMPQQTQFQASQPHKQIQFSQSSQTFQLTQPSQPSQLTQPSQVAQASQLSQSSQLAQASQSSQQSYLASSNPLRNYNIPIEKVVWDYLHFLYRQNTGILGYFAPYIDESFNIGKFHCLVTEFCKRQRVSKDALIINSKNWFKECLDQRESIQNLELTLECEINKYVESKIKRYEGLGFKLESDKISKFYCKLVPYMIKNLWRRLENASYQRVDWSSKQFLGSEVDPKFCNYDMVGRIMKLNGTNSDESNKDNSEALSGNKAIRSQDIDKEILTREKHEGSDYMMDSNSDSGNGRSYQGIMNGKANIKDHHDHRINGIDNSQSHDQNYSQNQNHDDIQINKKRNSDEYDELTKEMVIVSRTQKWLLRNVKLEDFKYLIRVDQLREENALRNSIPSKHKSKSKSRLSNSNTSVRLPRKTQNAILDYINLCNFKT